MYMVKHVQKFPERDAVYSLVICRALKLRVICLKNKMDLWLDRWMNR